MARRVTCQESKKLQIEFNGNPARLGVKLMDEQSFVHFVGWIPHNNYHFPLFN